MTVAVFLVSLVGAMAIGMPIAFALLICGVALMFHLDMMDGQIVAQNLIGGADSFSLMAVPFFILAGEIMNTGGLSRRIVNVALTLVGHIEFMAGASCIGARPRMPRTLEALHVSAGDSRRAPRSSRPTSIRSG
jgi:TRAP-type mannitol/chloroaromatic compound transport system permease large subunit